MSGVTMRRPTRPRHAPALDVSFFGHASIRLAIGGTSVVTDPWFSRAGAFLGSWAQFPDNSALDLDAVRGSSFVAISHDHADHFDIDFLRTVDPGATIIVPGYQHPRLRDVVASELPNELLVVKDRVPIELGDGITLVPMLQSVPVWDDCAFLFIAGGTTILDLNDIKLPAADIDWIARNFDIDYLFLQFSGANWHPHAYTYRASKKVEIARRKVQTKFGVVKNIVEQLDPKCVVPCAGPACFLDDDLFALNFSEDSTFPTQREFVEYARGAGFGERIAVMLPGDTIDASTDWCALTTENLLSAPFADRERYLHDYRDRRLPVLREALARIEEPEQSMFDECRAYFEPLVRSTPYLAERIGGAMLLELTGPVSESIVVDFTRLDEPVRRYDGEPWRYRLRTEARFVREIIAGRLLWEELLLSMRFRATRRPDVYSEPLTVFLRYADPEQYARFEQYERRAESDERFVLHHDGRDLCVQRTCPHAGGDLARGHLDGDYLVCPVHGWRFSLRDGVCDRSGYQISVEPISADEAVSSRST